MKNSIKTKTCFAIFINYTIITIILIAIIKSLINESFAKTKEIEIISKNGAINSFVAEIAITPEQLSKGLMNRTSLPENHSMLFIFPKSKIVSMWMKNTSIKLDMLFINKDKEIVYIKENATPYSLESISFPKPVKYVLEINGGKSKQLAIEVGDHLIYPKK